MKLIALVKEEIKNSDKHMLLEFIASNFRDLFDLEVVDITEESLASQSIEYLNKKIATADGVVIPASEDNEIIVSAVQSLLENKAVLVISEFDYNQNSSASQLQLRLALENPAVSAYTFPGNDFFLGDAIESLDGLGQIQNHEIIDSLRKSFKKYIRFVELVNEFEEKEILTVEPEDLYATKSIKTTINGLDKGADDWFEQALEKVRAVEGNTYVKLDRGILTVEQLNSFLNSMPMELTFMDSNNQFLYYNYHMPAEAMLASTQPNQVGSPIAELHPAGGHERVEMLIQQLRTGKIDSFPIHVPTHGPDKFVVHNYKAIRDKTGDYLGVNEYVLDLQPIIDWYLKQTNQELVGGPFVDAISSASTKDDDEVDGVSSASTQY